MQQPPRSVLLAVVAAVSCVLPCAANEAEKGRSLAERMCAACHMQPGQGEKRGPDGLPGFAAIASRPDQSHEAIVRWLRSRPPMMPDHHLTWDEADALAAFIMSLR